MKHALLAALALLAGACQSASGPAAPEYTLITLVTGTPPAPIEPARQGELFQGHFSNMKAMADAGDLLLAGPFGADKADESWRGLFVMAEGEPERALEIAASDPTTEAGIFDQRAQRLRSRTDFARFREIHEAYVATDPPDAEAVRGFTLATAPGAAALAALGTSASNENVLVSGLLDGDAFVILDLADPAAAREALARDVPDATWSVSSMWATTALADMPRGVDAEL